MEQSLQKFKGYQIFGTLDEVVQERFKKIYELLKIWQQNLKTHSLPSRESVRALRSVYSMEKVILIFSKYYKALEEILYDKSRMLKQNASELYKDVSDRRVVGEQIKRYRAEVHTFGATVDLFREFYLRTHPNPYVRTRWGFTEWIVGPEPKPTRELLDMVYQAELLDKLFEKLDLALQKGPLKDESLDLSRQYREMQYFLHEMGQPLASRRVMRSRAEKVLEKIDEIDELGSFNLEMVDFVRMVFSKAMRVDWQYHVLFEIPLFHQLYQIHQGISGPSEDRLHFNRDE